MPAPPPPDRSALSPRAIVRDLWTNTLGLPASLLDSNNRNGQDDGPGYDDDYDGSGAATGPLALPGLDGRTESRAGVDAQEPALPSSFRIGALAQSVVALAALTAALADATRAVSDSRSRSQAQAQPAAARTSSSAPAPASDSGPDTGPSSSSSSSSVPPPLALDEIRLPRVTVPLRHAVAEFHSERIYTLAASSSSEPPKPPASVWGSVGGLYATPRDGSFVRIHDALPNHAAAALRLLGLRSPDDDRDPAAADDGHRRVEGDAAAGTAGDDVAAGGRGDSNSNKARVGVISRAQIAEKVARHTSVALESLAHDTPSGAVLYALRSYGQWDAHPQAACTPDTPILIRRLLPGPSPSLPLSLVPSSPSPLRTCLPALGDDPAALWSSSSSSSTGHTRGCLAGLRVLELSRVIAAPVAGRTLAAHGADVLWVTSPSLPALPALDADLARGKRTIQLDLAVDADARTLRRLVRDADVFIQGYRPGSSLTTSGDAATTTGEKERGLGFAPADLALLNPNLIVANLSAFGPDGPWARRRGFDSLVQTCTGMNVSEAAHRAGRDDDDGAAIDRREQQEEEEQRRGEAAEKDGSGEEKEKDEETTKPAAAAALPMPCQALDHASGYLLAAGICAALHRRAAAAAADPNPDPDRDPSTTRAVMGVQVVNVSLAAAARYLRSLGQYPGARGFDAPGAEARRIAAQSDVDATFFETRGSGLGTLTALRHSAAVEGRAVGWREMPKPLGSDEPRWL